MRALVSQYFKTKVVGVNIKEIDGDNTPEYGKVI
jgi:hypothetical protein